MVLRFLTIFCTSFALAGYFRRPMWPSFAYIVANIMIYASLSSPLAFTWLDFTLYAPIILLLGSFGGWLFSVAMHTREISAVKTDSLTIVPFTWWSAPVAILICAVCIWSPWIAYEWIAWLNLWYQYFVLLMGVLLGHLLGWALSVWIFPLNAMFLNARVFHGYAVIVPVLGICIDWIISATVPATWGFWLPMALGAGCVVIFGLLAVSEVVQPSRESGGAGKYDFLRSTDPIPSGMVVGQSAVIGTRLSS